MNAGLKEFAVMSTKLSDVREMNDNSSFVSATNEVFIMEFCLSSSYLLILCLGFSFITTAKDALCVQMYV